MKYPNPFKAIFLAWALLIASNAFAARYVIRSEEFPRIDAARFKVVKVLVFGSEKYVVVETKLAQRGIFSSFPNARVTEDLPIGLVDGQEGTNSSGKAWHVDEMKYADLPKSADGQGVIVAVLDTGVDYTHPSLKDRLWTNPHVDVEYPDDLHGYNFVDHNGDVMDSNGHGTHCAGIIAAEKDPESDAQGVAPGVKVMPLKVTGGGNKETFLSDAAEAMKFAVDHGAKVLSNSWRVYGSWGMYHVTPENLSILEDGIRYAEKHGVLVVVAAGNENLDIENTQDPLYPAGFLGHPNLLVVAASGPGGSFTEFTNFGEHQVQVAAPGENILSTELNHSWLFHSGTSMATPLVAGVLARALSAGDQPDQALARLASTSTPMDQWKSKVVSGGVISPMDFLKPLTGSAR